MTEAEQIRDLHALVEETTTALGATDQTYIQLLSLLQKNKKLSMPSRLLIGQMVFFKYKPVSESFISGNRYYDAYPLVMLTNVYRGGFEGINLHYLEAKERTFLFDSIMRSVPTLKANEKWRTRILIDYDKLNASRKFRFFEPCYKRYLWDGIKRRPVVIPYDFWNEMVQTNTSRFAKARPHTVHRESQRRVIRGN